MPRAFITGITGQDGQHLAEFLHGQGYDVFGMVKGQNNPKAAAVVEEMPFVELVPGDLADLPSLVAALELAQPDEVYNLGRDQLRGAVVHPGRADGQHDRARRAADARGDPHGRRDAGATRSASTRRRRRRCSARCARSPQNELTPFHPRSPYGCAKVFGHDITVNYRESYGLFACSGILFNHEGPRRGHRVRDPQGHQRRGPDQARPAARAGARHLDTKRDWGYAGDYVRAMWLMLQQDEPDDYVVATGETHTVEEFVERAFAEVGIDDWRPYVRQDPKFFRPAEVDLLIGDATKARTKLGWQPEVDFAALVKMMVAHDLEVESRRAGLSRPSAG